MPEPSDDELIRMYRDGDAGAFETLFDRHYRSVYGFARAILGDSSGPEEVLQEAFLAVARTAGTYTPRGRFRSWLMRIVRNRCLNRLATERARREAVGRRREDVSAIASHEPPPAERADDDEQAAILRAAIAALPERQRDAIALYAFERMSYREVAELLEMPINTVKTLIHRARADLARQLRPLEQEKQT